MIAVEDTMVSVVVAVPVTIGSRSSCCAPADTVGEDGAGELRVAKVKGDTTVEGNVVEAPVPDGGVGHAVSRKSHDCADTGASKNIVPVVELVNGEGATNKDSAKDGGVNGNELPHGGVVVGKDLELCVEVEVEVDKAGKGRGGVARGEGLKTVIDGVWVACADIPSKVDLFKSGSVVLILDQGGVGLADGEEVGAQTTNKPLEEDLEDGSGDEGVEEANDGVVGVPEGTDADLAD